MYISQFFAASSVRPWALSAVFVLLSPTLSAQNLEKTTAAKSIVTNVEPTTSGATVLARAAGGVFVSVDDVLSELQRVPVANRQIMMGRPDALQQTVNNLLVRRVLAKEAELDHLSRDSVVAATLAIARDRVLSDARLAKIDVQNTPSEQALDAYARSVYQTSPARFEKPAQARARHILLPKDGADSLAKAQALLAELRSGASFEALAKAHSTDAGSAANGGDLGFFSAGKMVKPFEDAVDALAKSGDLSEPVESQFGYHIIKLEERREKGVQPYSEVRDQLLMEARAAIINEARVQKVQSLHQDFVFDQAAIAAFAKPATR